MKNVFKIFSLLLLFNFFVSCTIEDIDDGEPSSTEEILATGDDSSGEVDDDRDGD